MIEPEQMRRHQELLAAAAEKDSGESERRSDDLRLQELAHHLTPDLRARLVDLVAAEGHAVSVDQLEHRVVAAQDLIDELRRHLAVRDHQCERLREQLAHHHADRCCSSCGTHANPHVGCILR